MNPRLAGLQAYPFERLAALKRGLTPPASFHAIDLSIGEPKHAAAHQVTESIIEHLHGISQYPKTAGLPALREAITRWLAQRFQLPADFIRADTHVLPVNGTREALFSIAQALLDPCASPREQVLMPNPFYQIYEGAAILAGGEPVYLNAGTDGQPDYRAVDEATWQRTRLLYICSPNNPTGAVLAQDTLAYLIDKAQQHDFVIASDECYSEIYLDEANPPVGILQAAASMGHHSLKSCLAFHSLSKRSNMPGARSGFVAGDPQILKDYLLYRTYLGNATPPFIQSGAIAAWQDEAHVCANRAAYREKFTAVLDILGGSLDVSAPEAGFYLWPKVGDGEAFARDLFATKNVTVLPGAYLSRQSQGQNPGKDRVRIALVAPLEECVEAARRIRDFVDSNKG
ncbi:succinyldiaminopimelate transaminase [Thermithiobacillus plumbiphilus]|uniref:Succinyldiaminopimelate transaminase n=1 Tax=Thermithiobacillus plumbiphilus TaxID=1729899 RepID=A0ABU9D434_9PROT